MLINFKYKNTESFYKTGKSKSIPSEIQKRALMKLVILNSVFDVDDLKIPPSNHLESLSGNLEGFYSIRINKQFRIIFRFSEGNSYDVYIDDYH